MADYDAAIHLDRRNAGAFNGRCYAEAILGRLNAALLDCDRSLELRPNDANTLDSRGYARLRGGHYADAIADYDAAIRLYAAKGSGGAESYFGRGVAYRQLGNSVQAEQDFRMAGALDPAIETKMARIGLTR